MKYLYVIIAVFVAIILAVVVLNYENIERAIEDVQESIDQDDTHIFRQELYQDGDGNAEKPTWNKVVFTDTVLISFSDRHPRTVFNSIIDEVAYVFRQNPRSGIWDWYDFSDNTGQIKVIYSDAYYVYVTADCVLEI